MSRVLKLRVNGISVKVTQDQYKQLEPYWARKVHGPKKKKKKKLKVRKVKKTKSDNWLQDWRKKYYKYLESPVWAKIREEARLDSYYRRCCICDSEYIVQLHHVTYKYLYSDTPLRDVIPVCKIHHEEIHKYQRAQKVSVSEATDIINKKYNG